MTAGFVQGFKTKLNENAALDSWDDFANEEFNFKLAGKVRDVTSNMLSVHRDAKTASSLNENYLAAIGLTKKTFQRRRCLRRVGGFGHEGFLRGDLHKRPSLDRHDCRNRSSAAYNFLSRLVRRA
ncbi:MAG: hypothetical protein IJQ01_00300 [Selenomonadaceae bacterium]|nr:hypothetical protein [Selenomonadaceae bacterium]